MKSGGGGGTHPSSFNLFSKNIPCVLKRWEDMNLKNMWLPPKKNNELLVAGTHPIKLSFEKRSWEQSFVFLRRKEKTNWKTNSLCLKTKVFFAFLWGPKIQRKHEIENKFGVPPPPPICLGKQRSWSLKTQIKYDLKKIIGGGHEIEKRGWSAPPPSREVEKTIGFLPKIWRSTGKKCRVMRYVVLKFSSGNKSVRKKEQKVDKYIKAKCLNNQTDMGNPVHETPWRGHPHIGGWRGSWHYSTTWHEESVAQHLFRCGMCVLTVHCTLYDHIFY